MDLFLDYGIKLNFNFFDCQLRYKGEVLVYIIFICLKKVNEFIWNVDFFFGIEFCGDYIV